MWVGEMKGRDSIEYTKIGISMGSPLKHRSVPFWWKQKIYYKNLQTTIRKKEEFIMTNTY